MRFETIPLSLPGDGQRLDAALVSAFADTSRAQIQGWIKQGLVKTTDEKPLTQASFKIIKPTDIILLRPVKTPFAPPAAEQRPEQLVIIYEDDHLIVVNKPVGLTVHPGAGRPDGTLVNALLAHTGGRLSDVNTMERPGIVHRLDKDTSGLMVVAKTNFIHVALAEALQERRIKRVYQALAWNIPSMPLGVIDTMMGRDPKNRQRRMVMRMGGKKAVTHYKVLERFDTLASLVECQLQTGRTHQIRVHLAHLNCPVIGDRIYTGRSNRKQKLSDDAKAAIDRLPGQALHAYSLSFIHPVTEESMVFTAQPPEIFLEILTLLRKS